MLNIRCNYFGNETTSVSLPGYTQNLPTFTFLDDLRKPFYKTRIIHSCNGLMLLQNYYLDFHKRCRTRYIVSNFTLHKYIILPQSVDTFSSHYELVLGAYLIFDLSKSPHYKVVVIGSHLKIEPRGHFRDIDIYYWVLETH